MFLRSLGWNEYFETNFSQRRHKEMIPARVSEESKGSYRVMCEEGEFAATIAGKIRFHGQERFDLPAVGDWVVARLSNEKDRAVIESVLPRQTLLSRRVAGRKTEEQVLAANINTVFVVSSLNQELNIKRLERYLSMVWQSGAIPVIVLTKADLCEDPEVWRSAVERAALGVEVCIISAQTGYGIESVKRHLSIGKTIAFVGSSGVGKSTLINFLSGTKQQKIADIRESDDHGRHTTSSRQMILLPGSALVIDTPGMRELQLWDAGEGLTHAFADVEELAANCRFRNCRHKGEPGCAVDAALKEGVLPYERFVNYEKLKAELRFLQMKTDVKLRQETKSYAKRLCKNHRRRYPKF